MSYVKKVVIYSCSLMSFSVIAGTMGEPVDPTMPKERFYAGIGVGGFFNTDSLQVIATPTATQTIASNNSGHVVGNVYIGYGHTYMDKLFLGIEANTYFPHHSVTYITQGVSNVGIGHTYVEKYTFTDYLGLDLLPGYRVNSKLLTYGRVGLAFRDLSVNQNSDGPSSLGFYNAGTSVGGRFGAGVSCTLSHHLAASIDYFYTYYPTWGSAWNVYQLQLDMRSHANYAGISLVYSA